MHGKRYVPGDARRYDPLELKIDQSIKDVAGKLTATSSSICFAHCKYRNGATFACNFKNVTIGESGQCESYVSSKEVSDA